MLIVTLCSRGVQILLGGKWKDSILSFRQYFNSKVFGQETSIKLKYFEENSLSNIVFEVFKFTFSATLLNPIVWPKIPRFKMANQAITTSYHHQNCPGQFKDNYIINFHVNFCEDRKYCRPSNVQSSYCSILNPLNIVKIVFL